MSRIDPRLYPSPHSSAQTSHHYSSSAAPLPAADPSPIDQRHQLPPLSNNAPLQQPYYRLPPASAPLQHQSHHQQHQPPTPVREQRTASNATPYDPATSHQIFDQDEQYAHTDITVEDAKRSRACEACRGLKVRCDRDEGDPGKPCRRCAKARRNCVITAPSRKRQKKSDTRVAELEKKIDELSQNLQRQQQHEAPPTSHPFHREAGPLSPPQSTYSASTTNAPTPPVQPTRGPWRGEVLDRNNAQATSGRRATLEASPERTKQRMADTQPDIETYMAQHRPRSSRTDESDASNASHTSSELPLDSIVNQETAARVFNRYVAEMAQHLPAVMFDAETSAAEIRSKRPILFLAILDTASVGMLEMDIQLRLNEMLLDVYANSILRNGEKSLDLIQALMVSTIWYRPPKRYEQMNVYLLTHISALMALDFGMGRKLNASRTSQVATNVGQAQTPKSFLRSDSVEARRTWLGCYFVCMNVSLSLRRPNFIRWNGYLDECIKVLESAPETLPSDKRLCQHVKLMHINEEVGLRFSMDDPSATIAISDPRVQFAIGAFEKRLEEWNEGVPQTQWDLSLEFSKNFSRLYMHEIALHNNHNIDDFRAPFTEESLKAPSVQLKALTPYHQGLLTECLAAVHSMFNTFAMFDLTTVKGLPIFYFVRIAYAVVVLIKLRNATVQAKSELPFKEEDLRVEDHLDAIVNTFQRLAGEDAFRPARMFMVIISKLRDGFKASKGGKAHPSPKQEGRPWAIEEGVPDRRRAPAVSIGSVSKRSSHKGSAAPSVASEGPREQELDRRFYTAPAPAQQHTYSNAQTPLHFLSEVATNDAASAMSSNGATYQQSQPGWYGQTQMPQQMQHQQQHDNAMIIRVQPGSYPTNADPAFEQAMDMTMSIGDGDLSSLFMDGRNYGAPGLVPEGHVGNYAGGSGW